MLIEKGTVRSEAVFSDNRDKRYLLRKEWDAQKKRAMLIMTNPSSADLLMTDYTTLYTINNLVRLDYGSVDIVNLVPKTTTKLNIKEDIGTDLDDDNVTQVLKAALKADSVIVAWGKIGENNQAVRSLQEKLLEQLKPHAEKLYQICDDNGEFGFHPLAPSVRFSWHLVKFEIPEKPSDTAEAKTAKKDKKKQSQTTAPADLPIQETETTESA